MKASSQKLCFVLFVVLICLFVCMLFPDGISYWGPISATQDQNLNKVVELKISGTLGSSSEALNDVFQNVYIDVVLPCHIPYFTLL